MNEPDSQDEGVEADDQTLDARGEAYRSLWRTLALDGRTMQQRPGSTIAPEQLRRSQELSALVRELPTLMPARDATARGGDLRLVDTIGQGGMGVVFLAEQRSVGREVAVKAVREDRRQERARQGLLQEGWTAGRLEHPNIVPIHAIGLDDDGFPMIVMKRIEGVSWREALDDIERLPSAFVREAPLASHLEILRQLCQAVHFANSRHILHRDLKPDNVMLGAYGEVYLVDWGVAVSLQDDGSGQLPLVRDAGQIAGTPSYMAPELASADVSKQDARTDVYLLGAILHEIVTGEPRHEGRTLYEVMMRAYVSAPVAYGAEVPEELGALANAACAREPAERPASAEVFRQALLRFERHALSLTLTDEAEQRLERLRALGHVMDEGRGAQVYRGFGAARFGFEQALREWEDNRRASAGLDALLVWMVEHEIAQQRAEAATALLAELGPARFPQLAQQIDALRELLRERAEELHRLKRLDREVDVDVSSQARGQVMLWLALLWLVLPLGARALDVSGVWPLDYVLFSLLQLVMDVCMLTVLYVYRGPLMRNQANRRMVYLLLFTFVMSFSTRHLSWLIGISIPHAAVCELLVYATACLNLAATIDRRVWPAGAFYLIFAVVIGLLPQHMLELMAFGNAAAMVVMGKTWDKTLLGLDV